MLTPYEYVTPKCEVHLILRKTDKIFSNIACVACGKIPNGEYLYSIEGWPHCAECCQTVVESGKE